MEINLDQAVKELNQGKVIGVFTDTVIGLATLPEYEQQIYTIKNRSADKPIIQLIASIDQIGQLDARDKEILAKYWPGAVSIIVDNQGYRIPNYNDLILLLEQTGPLSVSSANISNNPVVENKTQFYQSFPDIKLYPSNKAYTNIPSTILKYDKINKTMEKLR